MRLGAWRWLVVAIGIVMALGAAELALRARYRQRVLPGAPSEPGKVTIVALGDSITAGWPGPQDQAWPALIGARLKIAYPAITWQVINAGAPGNTAPMGYARFEREVAAYAPDLVLIAFGLNDCHRARHALDCWFEARVPGGLERSYVWRALQARAERLGRRLGWLEELPPEPVPLPLLRTSPAGFTIALSALIDRSEDIHSRPVLLTMPPLSQQLPAEARVLLDECPAYDARIRALAAKRGTPWVELTGPAPDGAFTVDGLHLTAAGQQLAADRVYETLEKAGLWAALAGRAR